MADPNDTESGPDFSAFGSDGSGDGDGLNIAQQMYMNLVQNSSLEVRQDPYMQLTQDFWLQQADK